MSSGDALQFDVFNTIIVEIEGILNRRPLTQISTDSKDVEALTPNHILAPASAQLTQERLVDTVADKGDDVRASWRRAVGRINGFWKAFKSDYLQLLHNRQKWTKSKENLKQGRIHGVISRMLLGRGSNITDSLQR